MGHRGNQAVMKMSPILLKYSTFEWFFSKKLKIRKPAQCNIHAKSEIYVNLGLKYNFFGQNRLWYSHSESTQDWAFGLGLSR